MATTRTSFLNNHLHFINGLQSWMPKQTRTNNLIEHCNFPSQRQRQANPARRVTMKLQGHPSIEFVTNPPSDKIVDLRTFSQSLATGRSEPSPVAANLSEFFVLANLGPASSKLAIGILGPSLSAFSFLFIARIVMSWYPNLPVGKFPYVVAYAPTEPLLVATRKVIPPLGGVDVTPIVWFGLVSFLNEILVGPQGLLVLLSQQLN